MVIAGIIAEYDPFHKGHAAHIAATRKAGATHIAAVISGGFTQRGEPALLTKWERTQMALAGGADLVLELPVPWAMAPAEYFAAGGVAVLRALGCVNLLSFGSECGDTQTLYRLADALDAPDHTALLRDGLRQGLPYAAARQQAVAQVCGQELAGLLEHPNNTLGLSYIRAMRQQDAPWDVLTVQRQGTAHHSQTVRDGFASAGLLRQWIRQGNIENATACMPTATADILRRAVANGQAPSNPSRLQETIPAYLRMMTPEEMQTLPYLSEGLHNRLYRVSRTAATYQDLLDGLQTKRYPTARLRRLLWAAMLRIPAHLPQTLPPYARILGMNDRGREILAASKPTLPLLTRPKQLSGMSQEANQVFRLEQRATDLHGLSLPSPLPCGTDLTVKFHHNSH